MRLHVMRHGPTEDRAPSGRDFDRALTPAGRELVRRMGEVLRRQVRAAPRILASPRRRARETAVIVAEALGLSESAVDLREELGGEGPIPLELVAEVAPLGAEPEPDSKSEVLLVGHQPCVEELVHALLHPTRPRLLGFRTATIVSLALDPDAGCSSWTLEAVLDPDRVAR